MISIKWKNAIYQLCNNNLINYYKEMKKLLNDINKVY